MMEYTRYEPKEVRIYKACFWLGILLLILWVEIVIGIAIARLLLAR